MNKQCAKCNKTVYPIELLNCLDKHWHKSCFRCTTCSMTLNMKNYKGYNKLPYCNAHYPTTKFTAVADTPENRRISENTKNQSSIQYQSEYEQSKDRIQTPADTVAMQTHQRNKDNFSLFHYHSDYQQSKDKILTVVDSPAMLAHQRNKTNCSLIHYHSEYEQSKDKIRTVVDSPAMLAHQRNKTNCSLIKYHEEFEKQKGSKVSVADDPETSRIKHNTEIQSNVAYWGIRDQRNQMERNRPDAADVVAMRKSKPGKISDYDPGAEDYPSPYSQRSSANVVYDSQRGGEGDVRRTSAYGANKRSSGNSYAPFSYGGGSGGGGGGGGGGVSASPYDSINNAHRMSGGQDPHRSSYNGHRMQSQRVQPGSIADYDPMNDRHSSIVKNSNSYPSQPEPPRMAQPEPSRMPPPQHQPPPAAKQPLYRAIYDYNAADDDEVSFMDGDEILDVSIIDEGWMTGLVKRTGQHGMLPSNYVERVN